jgi:HAD superfamily hydrolase (TIGR01450 family)
VGSELTGWAIDLDGVVWLSGRVLDGAPEAVSMLRQRHHEVAFVTNSSFYRRDDVAERLAAIGIDALGGVITSAMATASLLKGGESALVIGGPGLREAVSARGVDITDDPSSKPDAVIIGIDPNFDYQTLSDVMVAVERGARLLATNRDPSFPTPDGLRPGCGALVAAVCEATGVEAIFGGKPEAATLAMVQERLGDGGVVAGDRSDTDGAMADALGYRFALIASAVNTGDQTAGKRFDGLLDAVTAWTAS